ncbi:hypothetical protein ABZ208_37185 [Streptomyces sp. NPDC006208]|uniref:hypothetical protein n=1 Tax=Streptomyces sp. NPDC006208 TaxID=3156734 RepID=UPI0033AD9048
MEHGRTFCHPLAQELLLGRRLVPGADEGFDVGLELGDLFRVGVRVAGDLHGAVVLDACQGVALGVDQVQHVVRAEALPVVAVPGGVAEPRAVGLGWRGSSSYHASTIPER